MTYIRYGNQNKMFREHQKTLDSISKKYLEHSRLKKMANQLEWDISETESIVKANVLKQVDSLSKPLYKNVESRNSAIESDLRINSEYNKLREMLDDAKDQLVDVDNDIKMAKHKLKFFEEWS